MAVFLWNLCQFAFFSAFTSVSTNLLGVTGTLVYPIADLIRELWSHGWIGMGRHWRERVKFSFIIGFGWWSLLFSYQLFYKIPQQIRMQAANISAPQAPHPPLPPKLIKFGPPRSHGAPPTLESRCAAIGIFCGQLSPSGPLRYFIFKISAIKSLENPVKFRVECDSLCRPFGTSAPIRKGEDAIGAATLEYFTETTYINVLLPPNMLFEAGMDIEFRINCASDNPLGCRVTTVERFR